MAYEEEVDGGMTITFRSEDGAEWDAFRAGRHVSLTAKPTGARPTRAVRALAAGWLAAALVWLAVATLCLASAGVAWQHALAFSAAQCVASLCACLAYASLRLRLRHPERDPLSTLV